jgi:uncharacterized repeat protein (TIGR01451 family)
MNKSIKLKKFLNIILFSLSALTLNGLQASTAPANAIIENRSEAIFYDEGMNLTTSYSNTVSLIVANVMDFDLRPLNIKQERYRGDVVLFGHELESLSNSIINIELKYSNNTDDDFNLQNLKSFIDKNENGIIDEGDVQLIINASNTLNFQINETKKILITGEIPNFVDFNNISTINLEASIPLVKKMVSKDEIKILTEPVLEISGYANKETATQKEKIVFFFDNKNISDANALKKKIFIDSAQQSYIIVDAPIPANTTFETYESGSEDLFVYHIAGSSEFSYTTMKPAILSSIDKVAFLYNEFEANRNETGSYSIKINNNASESIKTIFSVLYTKNNIDEVIKTTNDIIVKLPKIEPTFDNYNKNFLGITNIIRIGTPLNIKANASSCNIDSSIKEEYFIKLESDISKDIDNTFKVIETSENSGIFEYEGIPTVLYPENDVEIDNSIMEVTHKDEINVSLECNGQSLSSKILVDPIGIVFNSMTNSPIENVKVTLIGLDEFGNEFTPEVFDLENKKISNIQYTDQDGLFWFPLVNPSDYKFILGEHDGYKFPSKLPINEFSLERTIDESGSFGGSFNVSANSGVVTIDIPLDPLINNNLLIQKIADVSDASIGDVVVYTITVTNTSLDDMNDIKIIDTLPLGLKFLSSENNNYTTNLNKINFVIPKLFSGEELEINYRVLVKMNAVNGSGINMVQASSGLYKSNIAKHQLNVNQESVFENPLILGKIYKDCNNNELKDEFEFGIPGIKIYLDNGSYAITDRNGNYKFYNLKAKTYSVRIDKMTLITPYDFKTVSNRNAMDSFSSFADLKYGDLNRTDFRDVNCSIASLNKLRQRISNLESLKTEVEKSSERELDFNSNIKNDIKSGSSEGLINEKEENISKIYILKDEMEISNDSEMTFIDSIMFDVDSTNISNYFQDKLKEISSFMVDNNNKNIEIVGHADSSFTDEYNQNLSEKRSNVVFDALVNNGVSDNRITTSGKGEKFSIASNETKEGKQKNRRVELYFYDNNLIKTPNDNYDNYDDENNDEMSDQYGDVQYEDEKNIIEDLSSNKKFKLIETTINLEKYAEEIQYNTDIDFVDLSNDDVLLQNQLSIRVKGLSIGSIQLLINNNVIETNKIGQVVNFKEFNLKVVEYIAVKLKTGLNIIEVRNVDPFGNIRDSKAIKVIASGDLSKIKFHLPEKNQIPANSSKPFPVIVSLTDINGIPVYGKYTITLKSTVGHWDVEDINDIERGIQTVIENGEAVFDLIPPNSAESGKITGKINDIKTKEKVYATTYLRDLFAVGVIEGAFNFADSNISENIQTTGLENEISKFNLGSNGKARISLFLKGKVKGDYLLTLAYDSDKDSKDKLYKDIEPDEFYPIYGDSSINGFEAQSTSNIFVKVSKNSSYALYGDFNTREYSTGTISLGNYNRTLTGFKHNYQNQKVNITYYFSEENFGARIKEIAGRGSFGPYDFSDGEDVVINSEKVFIVTKDKNTNNVVSEKQMTRFVDYEINGFYEGIIFREAVPSNDSDFNPVFVRVEYETNTNNKKYWVYGAQGSYNVNDDLSIGAAYHESKEESNEYNISSTSVEYNKNNLKVTAELAQSDSMGVKGLASKVYLKYNKDGNLVELKAQKADDDFTNEYSSIQGINEEITLKTKNKLTKGLNLKNKLYYTKDTTLEKTNKSLKTTLEKTVGSNLRIESGLKYTESEHKNLNRDSTMGSARITWQPDFYKDINTYVEYEQDLEVSDINRQEFGVEHSISNNGKIYLKQEKLSNLNSEIELSETKTENSKTIVGVNYGLNENTDLYSEYRIDEVISQKDAEAVVGVRNKFEINEFWKGNVAIERIESIEGERDSTSSLAAAFEHTQNKNWKTIYRLQYRNSEAGDYYMGSVGYIRKLNTNFSLLLKNSLAYEEGSSTTKNRFYSGISYRDNKENSLNYLLKYENEYIKEDDLYDNSHQLAFQFNKKLNKDMTINGMYSIKHITSEAEDFNYTANWLSGRFSYDINEKFDFGLTGSYLFDNETSKNYVLGLESGMMVQKNMWLSAGYNFEGLEDNKYSDESFTKKGFYLKFRMKLTEEDFKWLQ